MGRTDAGVRRRGGGEGEKDFRTSRLLWSRCSRGKKEGGWRVRVEGHKLEVLGKRLSLFCSIQKAGGKSDKSESPAMSHIGTERGGKEGKAKKSMNQGCGEKGKLSQIYVWRGRLQERAAGAKE